jgi:hypothetical protein
MRGSHIHAGQRRWWHIGHIVMATGMAAMYLLPRTNHPGQYRAGLVLFAVLAKTPHCNLSVSLTLAVMTASMGYTLAIT